MGLQSHCRTFNSGASLLRNFYVLGAGASTQQNTLPVRDSQKRCIAETLIKLSGTSSRRARTASQRTRPKAKNRQRHRSCSAPAEQKPPRNAPIRPLPYGKHLGALPLDPCRAGASPTTRRDLAGTPPQPSSPAVFGSGKHYACRHFAIGGLGHPYKP